MADLDDSVTEAWNDAERSIKMVEVLSGSTTVPAVNELRFAGRRLVDGLSLKEGDERDRYFQDALFHCLRARSDAFEAASLFLSVRTDELAAEIGLNQMPHEFYNLRTVLRQIQRTAIESRIDDSPTRFLRTEENLITEAILQYQNLRDRCNELEIPLRKRKSRVHFVLTSVIPIALGIASSAIAFLTTQLSQELAGIFSFLLRTLGLGK